MSEARRAVENVVERLAQRQPSPEMEAITTIRHAVDYLCNARRFNSSDYSSFEAVQILNLAAFNLLVEVSRLR